MRSMLPERTSDKPNVLGGGSACLWEESLVKSLEFFRGGEGRYWLALMVRVGVMRWDEACLREGAESGGEKCVFGVTCCGWNKRSLFEL